MSPTVVHREVRAWWARWSHPGRFLGETLRYYRGADLRTSGLEFLGNSWWTTGLWALCWTFQNLFLLWMNILAMQSGALQPPQGMDRHSLTTRNFWSMWMWINWVLCTTAPALLFWTCNSGACVQAQLLTCVWLFATPWTATLQAPLSVRFSRQEYWRRLSFPPPGYRH